MKVLVSNVASYACLTDEVLGSSDAHLGIHNGRLIQFKVGEDSKDLNWDGDFYFHSDANAPQIHLDKYPPSSWYATFVNGDLIKLERVTTEDL